MEIDTVRAIIEKKEDFIRRHVVLSTTVIEKLRHHDVIGEFTSKQMVGNQNEPSRQLTLLLASIKTRGLASFQGFLKVLRDTFHGWIADDILDSNVVLPQQHKEQSAVPVRDIINKYQHTETMAQTEQCFQPFGRSYPKLHESEINYSIPEFVPQGSRARHVIPDVWQPRYYVDRAQVIHRTGHNTKDTNTDINERHSPVRQIPVSLRDLDKIFDVESSSTRKSIAVLKQEELTIKALLQQNLREQQELLTKQESLAEIKNKMKQIGKSAIQLYKPEPDIEDSRSRLRHLQKTYWSSNSR